MIGAVQPADRQVDQPVFDAPNILWYFGGLVASFACLEVFTSVHEGARGLWILATALGFLGGYALLAAWLLRRGAVIAGGVIAAWSVVFVPVAGSAVERLIGVSNVTRTGVSLNQLPSSSPGPFKEFQGRELVLAMLLVAAGLAVYTLTRFPFVLAFVAVGALISAEFLVPAVLNGPTASDHATALIVFGLAFLVGGTLLDLRAQRREAFWFHLIGLDALAAGLTYHAVTHSSWGWELILIAGVLVLLIAAPLRRATWTLFGIVGVYAPLAHYAVQWFGNLGATAALAAIGFGFVALGIQVRAAEGSRAGVRFGRTPPASPPPA